jgi:serine-type D-Ala-D-Ala carboxypeptidase (penicillin-binding protein 5/6)
MEAGAPLENSARKVWFGTDETVELVPVNTVYITLPMGREGNLEAVLDAPVSLDAPLTEGQVVGTLSIQLGARTLAKTDVAVARAVPEGDLMKWAMDTVLRLFE